MILNVDGKVPLEVCDVHLNVTWKLMPPLGTEPWDVQDAHVDVKLDDALLEIDVYSKLPSSDVLLSDEVGVVLKMFAIVLLLDDVDKVNGQSDVEVLDFPTVLDEQDDVEVNLCDLL